jgi:hypothetical protein
MIAPDPYLWKLFIPQPSFLLLASVVKTASSEFRELQRMRNRVTLQAIANFRIASTVLTSPCCALTATQCLLMHQARAGMPTVAKPFVIRLIFTPVVTSDVYHCN